MDECYERLEKVDEKERQKNKFNFINHNYFMRPMKESTVQFWAMKKQMAHLRKEQEEYYNHRKNLAQLNKWEIVKARKQLLLQENSRIRQRLERMTALIRIMLIHTSYRGFYNNIFKKLIPKK